MFNSMKLLMFIPIISIMIILITSMMLKSNHPINFMIMLIIYTLMTSLMMNMNNSILSYMLFLIMIGGMMIMFLYFSSLINNEKSKFNKFTFLTLPMMLPLILNYYPLFNFMKINKIQDFNIPKMFSFPLYLISILMILFLLYCMINVIKMCKNNNIPLRKFI